MKKNMIPALMAGVTLLSSVVPVIAAEPETSPCTVSYSQGFAYTVHIPQTLTMDSTKTATYEVYVTGGLASDKKVTVTPDASFKMKCKNATKTDVDATVTQTKQDFTSVDITTDDASANKATGTISAPGLSEGDWSGTFNFTISSGNK